MDIPKVRGNHVKILCSVIGTLCDLGYFFVAFSLNIEEINNKQEGLLVCTFSGEFIRRLVLII